MCIGLIMIELFDLLCTRLNSAYIFLCTCLRLYCTSRLSEPLRGCAWIVRTQRTSRFLYWHYICRLIDCFIYVLLLCVYMYVCTCHRLYRSRHLSESHETSSGMLGYARRLNWSPRRSLAASWCLLSLPQLQIRGHCAGARPDLSCVGSV